jgi:DNA-binding NarL/FixJ family response regulator
MNKHQTIRLLIVDDHPMVREGLRAVIAQEPDIEVVGDASDGRSAVQQARDLCPDIILMDLLMPGMSGGQAVKAILAAQPAQRILLLTSVDEPQTLLETIRAGALGYVSKNALPAELLQAIRTVYRGNMVLPMPLARALLRSQDADDASPAAVSSLTEREAQVLELVAQGLSNDTIAAQLSISARTVSVHVSRILAKLELENRTQAALYAIRVGLVEL